MQRLGAGGGDRKAPMPETASTQGTQRNFLVFRLGSDEFGLPIEAIDEVAQVPEQITRLPRTPKFLEGVVNLRGDVLPVIDQRRRFEMPAPDAMQGRRLVVVRTERHRAGLIVDSVSDVVDLDAAAIKPPPALSGHAHSRFIQGLANVDNGMLILLNVEALVSQDLRSGSASRAA